METETLRMSLIHRLNPLQVYCRLKDRVSDKKARKLVRAYESCVYNTVIVHTLNIKCEWRYRHGDTAHSSVGATLSKSRRRRRAGMV